MNISLSQGLNFLVLLSNGVTCLLYSACGNLVCLAGKLAVSEAQEFLIPQQLARNRQTEESLFSTMIAIGTSSTCKYNVG